MKSKPTYKIKAIALRRAGHTIPDIARLVGISKSTASVWLRGIRIPKRAIQLSLPMPLKQKERMRNGEYILILAPKKYPGRHYRNRYAYEHHVVFWMHYGTVPGQGEIIHHKNGNKHDNKIENLVLMTSSEHSRHHANDRLSLVRSPVMVSGVGC